MNKAFNKCRHNRYAWAWCIISIDKMIKDIERDTEKYQYEHNQE